MSYVHEKAGWPNLEWNDAKLLPLLAEVRHRQGRLLGRMGGWAFGWHAALFATERSGMRRITVETWRPADIGMMQVVSGPMGRERVHLKAPTADRLEREVAAFLDWFEAGHGIDPVLKAGRSHFWFVTLHPFDDGNGRINRAMDDMALARAGGTMERFYSMSTEIEAEKKQYYLNREQSQKGGMDITPWFEWFLGCFGPATQAGHLRYVTSTNATA